jgi:hypothetical protein
MVSAGGFPGGAPVIAYFDSGDGSDSAKALGALEVKGKGSVLDEFPDRAQILRVE